MPRVARFACCIVLLMLVSAAGCDEEPARPRDRSTPPSSTPPTSATTATTTVETTGPSATPTTTSTDRTSVTVMRTGFTIIHEGRTIDAAGLLAIGWTVDPAAGTAHWSDPTLGEISVTWEVPGARAVANLNDMDFWAEVTAQNTATNPSMYGDGGFTGGPVEVTAHSDNGVKAQSPVGRLQVTVTDQPVGATGTVNINLGFPVPVLVTYNYVYI
jgi:hypothetical protein